MLPCVGQTPLVTNNAEEVVLYRQFMEQTSQPPMLLRDNSLDSFIANGIGSCDIQTRAVTSTKNVSAVKLTSSGLVACSLLTLIVSPVVWVAIVRTNE
jgi:hypothetical protein